MKIALSFPGCHRRGGVERIMLECARFLSQREHDVHVYAQEWEEDAAFPIHFHAVPQPPSLPYLRGPIYKRECEKMLRATNYDVLNTHGVVCPTGGVMWTQSIHRAWLEKSRTMRSPWAVARLKQRLNPLHRVLLQLEEEHYSRRNYQKIIATTKDVRDDLHHFYDVPHEDVVIIPNGFNPVEFNPERRAARRAEMRAQLGLQPEHIVLLFVANELERKGFYTLLDALRRLKRRDLRLVCIGRVDKSAVEHVAEEYGLRDQVLACGSTQDVAGFHAAADLFVLPTQYEAFCLAILESLGSGLPVVTTRVPGAYDAIVPGENGVLIEDPKSGAQLAEALQPLLDRNVREWMSDKTPATVVQYQWPHVLSRYEDVLKIYGMAR